MERVEAALARLRYALVLLIFAIAQRAPLQLSYALAAFLGDLTYLLWSRGRANAIDNMRHVLGPDAPERQVRRVARGSFRNYYKVLVDFARMPRLAREQVDRMISGRGWEHLDRAFADGKGVILVGTHLGNWELAGLSLAARNYPVHAVAEGFSNPYLDRFVRSSREARGLQIIPLESAGMRIYRALRQNHAVGLVVDRPLSDGKGVRITFFGEEVVWPAGPATLAVRTEARLITGYLVRSENGAFTGEMIPVAYQPSGDEEEDVRRLTQEIARIQEGLIRRFPDQWYMFRRMWPART